MRSVITRVFSCVLLVMVMSQDVDYRVWANEMETDKIIEQVEVEYVKANYTQKERMDIMKNAISKLEQGQEITPEESKVINWEYEELELTLPTDKVEWKKMIKEGKRGIGIGYRRSLQSDSNFCF